MDLRACRICLETSCKLLDINKNGLAWTLMEFTGISLTEYPNLPQFICNLCCHQLRKAITFKNKCLETQSYLHECSNVQVLTSVIINSIKFKHSLTKQQILNISYDQNKSNNNSEAGIFIVDNYVVPMAFTDEIKTENFTKINFIKSDDFSDDFDQPLPTDEVEISHDLKDKKSNNLKPKTKRKIVKRKPRKIIARLDPVIKDVQFYTDFYTDFLTNQISNTDNVDTQSFYTYIRNKYIDKTISQNSNIFDPLDSDEEILKIDKKYVADNDSDNHDSRKQFYKYLKNKYELGIKPIIKRQSKKKNKRERSKEDFEQFAKDFNFEVIMLSKKEQKEDVEARKERSYYLAAEFKCEKCYRGFQSEKVYKNHLLVHDPSTGSHICDICTTRFPTQGKLSKHKLTHKLKYICKSCNLVLKNSTEAKQHYAMHSGTEYYCEHCGKTFRRYRSRVEHIRIHHGSHICDICYKGLANPTAVIAHQTIRHRVVFSCDTCNVKFAKKSALSIHITTLEGGTCAQGVRPCSACGENLANEAQLQNHIATFHPPIKPPGKKGPSRPNTKKKCCPCGHKNQTITKQDTEIHTNGNISTDMCSVNFEHNEDFKIVSDSKNDSRSKVQLERNRQCDCPCKVSCEPNSDDDAAAKKNDIMCEICARTNFQSMTALRAHQMIHTGEKPHQCPTCSKTFRLKCLLQMHMTVHTGIRAYKCFNCEKTFKTAPARNRHLLVHTGVRRHKCPMCDKPFQTTSCLKMHVKTVHMKIPYPRSRAKRRNPDN